MTHIVFLRCKMLFTHTAVLAKEPFGAMYLLIIRPRSLSIPGKRLSETEFAIERNAADGLAGGLLRGTPLMLTLVLSSQKVQYKDCGQFGAGVPGTAVLVLHFGTFGQTKVQYKDIERLSRGIAKGVSPLK